MAKIINKINDNEYLKLKFMQEKVLVIENFLVNE